MPSTHGCGTTAKETLLIGHLQPIRIAIRDAHSCQEACDKSIGFAVINVSFKFARKTHILRIWNTKDDTNSTAVDGAVEGVTKAMQEIACGFNRKMQIGKIVTRIELLGSVDLIVSGIHDEVVAVLVLKSPIVGNTFYSLPKSGVDVKKACKSELNG